MYVIKRDGVEVIYDPSKIELAIMQAGEASKKPIELKIEQTNKEIADLEKSLKTQNVDTLYLCILHHRLCVHYREFLLLLGRISCHSVSSCTYCYQPKLS